MPLAQAARDKQKVIRVTRPIELGTLLGYSRRLGTVTRPPPEYSAPLGLEPVSVPGYNHPLPDVTALHNSRLQLQSTPFSIVRALPPEIDVQLQEGASAVYLLRLTSQTQDAKFMFAVLGENLPFREYDPNKPHVLMAPGEYSIQAYCTAPNKCHSEINFKLIKLTVVAEATAAQPTVVLQDQNSVFTGLFLEEPDSDEDSDDSSDDD